MFYEPQDGTGARIHYRVREAAAPGDIFFVHGNLASNAWWEPSEKLWGSGAGALIFAEIRGCGQSSAPKDLSEIDMHRLADDFVGLVRSLKRGPMNLVGHSAGGLIVALMMAKAPELFRRAVLLDPVSATGVVFDQDMLPIFEEMSKDRDLTAGVIGATIHDIDTADAFFQERIVEDAWAAVKTIGASVIKAVDRINVSGAVSQIQLPVLVLHGEYDLLLPMEDAQAFAKLLPRGTYRTLEGRGHCANVENPVEFVSISAQFLFDATAH